MWLFLETPRDLGVQRSLVCLSVCHSSCGAFKCRLVGDGGRGADADKALLRNLKLHVEFRKHNLKGGALAEPARSCWQMSDKSDCWWNYVQNCNIILKPFVKNISSKLIWFNFFQRSRLCALLWSASGFFLSFFSPLIYSFNVVLLVSSKSQDFQTSPDSHRKKRETLLVWKNLSSNLARHAF